MPISRKDPRVLSSDGLPTTLNEIILKTGNEWITKLRASLQENDRVSTGRLQSSMISEVTISPTYLQLEIKETPNAEGKYYAQAVDKGRKAGLKPPPVSAMEEFITNRAIKPIGLTATNAESAYKSLAYMLGQAIAKKGIKPTNFISEAVTKEDISKLRKDLAQAIKKGLK